MGFWSSIFGSGLKISKVTGTWAMHCAEVCKNFAPDAMSGTALPPQFELCCPNEEAATTLARHCDPYVLNMLSRKLSVTVFEDGPASVRFWPDLVPEMNALNSGTVWKMVDMVFKSPAFEERNVIVQNGYVFPTTEEARLELMSITRAGPDHALILGDAFIW